MGGKTDNDSAYVPGIDGLRAIAVLSVLIYHWRHTWIPGGFIGVDVFFVISGYVISKSLASGSSAHFVDYILRFYKRRFLRIIPALLFFLLLTSIASVLFVPPGWLSAPNKWTAIAAFFGASNFYLVGTADGYFSERIPFNPYVHTWSLAVEEQFYLIFPLIFYLWLKRGDKSAAWRTWTLPILAAVSLALAAYTTRVAHAHAFYLLPSRFWELAAGALLFQMQTYPALRRRLAIAPRWSLHIGAVLLAIGFAFTEATAFPFPWAIVPVIGTWLMIAGITAPGAPSPLRSTLESGPATYIGRISYSLYLCHWPVFSLFRWTAGLETPVPSAIALVLTFALAMYSYHVVENTFRQHPYFRQQSNGRVVALGLGSMVASSLVVVALFNPFLRLSGSVTADRAVWDPHYEAGSAAHDHIVNNIGAGKQLLVIGDSHAGAYETMVSLAAADLGASAKIFTRSGCSIAKLVVATKASEQCRDFERDALNWIKRNGRPGDIVFLASLRLDTFGNQWASFDRQQVLALSATPERIAERKLALQQAAEFIRKSQALGMHVLMDAPKPIFPAPPFRCSDWYNKANPICAPGFTVDRALLIKHREPIMQSLSTLHESLGVSVWDPFPVLCHAPVCSAFEGDNPLFADGHHLSGYGNRLLVPSFTHQLQNIWREPAAAAALN